MPDYKINEQWVDRYLRDELSEEEQEAFELALMDSPELQQELEAAMGVRAAVELEEQEQDTAPAATDIMGQKTAQWRSLAMAASVTLALFSTVMYWRTGAQVTDLQSEIYLLRQPITNVLRVPVDIMRSGNNQQPDVIVQKPTDDSMILLDIEVSPRARSEAVLNMKLLDEDGTVILTWESRPLSSGRHSAAVRASQLPSSLLTLEASDTSGEVLDRRLLEFR